MNTLAIFDAGAIFYCCDKKYNKKVDYEKLYQQLSNPIRAIIFGSYRNNESRSFINALKIIGWTPKFVEFSDRFRPRFDVDITVEAIKHIKLFDELILGSPDAVHVSLVRYLQEQGKKVTVIACGIQRPLKDAADKWIEITEDMLEVKDNAIAKES